MKKLILLTALTMTCVAVNIRAQSTTNLGTDSGTSGTDNTFIGYEAGETNTADKNTFIGSQAGEVNVGGSQNVFLGFMAGSDNSSGNNNVFLGMQAGSLNTAGHGNVAVGTQAGQKTKSDRNTIVGYFSGRQNSTGVKNAFFGHYAGEANVSGHYNVFIGNQAGQENTTGEHNTYIGSEAGSDSNGSNNVFIGYKTGYNETGSNKLYIDNSNTSTPLIWGDFSTDQIGINTSTVPTGFAFAVKGKIISEEVTVKVYPWADYVFDNSYDLPSLKEVESFINNNGHLQHIPTAEEVADKGVNVGEMESLLLRKIEELTLYTIQQEKEIEKQRQANQQLEDRLGKLEAMIIK